MSDKEYGNLHAQAYLLTAQKSLDLRDKIEKSILVIDTPTSCSQCKLKSTVHGIQNVRYCCNLAEQMMTIE